MRLGIRVEALLFMLNSAVMILMVYMGLRDDRRAPGMLHTSLFRTRDEAGQPDAVAPAHEDGAAGWAEWDRPVHGPRP